MTETNNKFARITGSLLFVQTALFALAAFLQISAGNIGAVLGCAVNVFLLAKLALCCLKEETDKVFFVFLFLGICGGPLVVLLETLARMLGEGTDGIQLTGLLLITLTALPAIALLASPLLICAGVSAFPQMKKYARLTGRLSLANTAFWLAVFLLLLFFTKGSGLFPVLLGAGNSVLWSCMGMWLAKRVAAEEEDVYYAEGYDAEKVEELIQKAEPLSKNGQKKADENTAAVPLPEEPILPPPVPDKNSDTVENAMKTAEKIKEYRKLADEGKITEEEFRSLKEKVLKF